jgi:hypothetical protein
LSLSRRPPLNDAIIRSSAAASGFGWLCPPPSPDLVGIIDPDDADWVSRRLVPQPLRTFTERTELGGAVDGIQHHVAVCRDGIGLPFADMAAHAALPEATVRPCGHDAMICGPDDVASFVAAAAAT